MTKRRNDRPAELQDRDRVLPARAAALAPKQERTFTLFTSALCFAFTAGVTSTVMVLEAAAWVQVTCGLALVALGACFVVRTGQVGTAHTQHGQDVRRETLGMR